MTVHLTYRYSRLDKRNNFHITALDVRGVNDPILYQWVWFYLGQLSKPKEFQIYPYAYYGNAKLVASYKATDAQLVAKRLIARMRKIERLRKLNK